ncbi:hypothetical protein BWQ96_04695 [Gracilariopsis chorda]|uniref:Uncharacterized protein n=1 Tax=Gracilariopsis chorda TaxID=448386 RepID=A0A2V3IV26_9FLOR|nr:hypothetical protein BWQ96_04695 [Gracilariopsis chorda]|eukprot:PXF45557.1 hypothetical protein BWQ96_04695 [Gracilariopsis chorda]
MGRGKERSVLGSMQLVGSVDVPVEVMVDEAVLSDFKGFTTDNAKSRVWKVAYEGLVGDFGFGMAISTFSAEEYLQIEQHLRYNKRLGDLQSFLGAEQCPVALRHNYVGQSGVARLTRQAKRRVTRGERCKLLDSMMVAQQYVILKVLERALVEGVHGANTDRTPRFYNVPLVWSVYCQFCVEVPIVTGMVDFIRVLNERMDEMSIEGSRSVLCSRASTVSGSGCKAWDGWKSNSAQAGRWVEYGEYIVLTLFPSQVVDIEGNSKGSTSIKLANNAAPTTTTTGEGVMEEPGVHVTVTEEIVRCYSAEADNSGLYCEYVAPLNPLDKGCVKTYYMKVGTSIVVPSTYAIRIGSHATRAARMFGYIVRRERLNKQKKGQGVFYKRDGGVVQADQLFEYGCESNFVREGYASNSHKATFRGFFGESKADERFMVGTIPSMLNMELNTPLGRKIVEPLYNVLPAVGSMMEVYRANPVLVLESSTQRQTRGGKRGEWDDEGVRTMGVKGEQGWLEGDVPYHYFESLRGKALRFPFNTADIREEEIR